MFLRMPKEKQRRLMKYALASMLAAALIFLVATGRLHWLIATIGTIAPFIPRILTWLVKVLPFVQPVMRYFKSLRGSGSGAVPTSQIETRFLRMILDHMTGDMNGEILQGELQGQRLNGLSLEQMLSFLKACREQDAESAALMMAFLDRYYPQWRTEDSSTHDQDKWQSAGMSREEACEILGVKANASEDEIITAHRRLVQKMHPDRGGTDYLAKKINQAKDVLLKSKK